MLRRGIVAAIANCHLSPRPRSQSGAHKTVAASAFAVASAFPMIPPPPLGRGTDELP